MTDERVTELRRERRMNMSGMIGRQTVSIVFEII